MAQTKIMYREKELMQLIHDHLVNKGEASQLEPVSQLYCHLVNKSEASRAIRASQSVSQSQLAILPSGQ